jgi:DNA-binding response OmpR family regulator
MLDVKMPKMNGFQLYEEIKKIDNKPKVCYITAYEINYEKLRQEFPSLEVDCFIKKPIKINELIRRINAELR